MPPPKNTPRVTDELRIDAKRRELETLRSRLVDRSNDLDVQAIELVTRRTELDKHSERLSELEEQLDARRQQLGDERERLLGKIRDERERLTGEITAERQRLKSDATAERRRLERQIAAHEQGVENDRRVLTARLQKVEQQEHDLEHRIAKARDEIVLQRAEVKELRTAAERRAGEVEAGSESLEAERIGWDEKLKDLLSTAGELDRRETALDRRDEQFERERVAFREQSEKLDASRQALDGELEQLEGHRKRIVKGRENLQNRAAQLDKQLEAERRKIAGEFDSERERVNRAQKKLESHEKKLAREREGLTERGRELKSAKDALDRRDRELAGANEKLGETEAGLAKRREAIDAFEARVGEFEKSLDRRSEELDQLTDRIEERDAQSRQTELALEVEEQEIARHRQALEAAERRLDRSREERRQEIEQTHAALRERVEKIEQAERSVLMTPPLWWLRASVSALVIGVAAGSMWLLWEKPVYRGGADLELRTTSPDVHFALSEHAALLKSAEVSGDWIDDAALHEVWRRSLRAGLVEAGVAVDPPRVQLALRGERRETVERVVGMVAERYRVHVNGVAAQPRIPAAYADIPRRKDQVVEEIRKAREQRREAETLLAVVPSTERRDELLAKVRELRGDHVETVRLLEEARQRLVLLERSADGLRGAVDPVEYERVLSEDESYQADRAEFHIEAVRYRKELSVGMVPLTELFAELYEAYRDFTQALGEQLEQRPSPATAGVLEECAGLVEDCEGRMREVEKRWAAWRSGVDKIEIKDNVAELFKHQAAVDEVARRLVRDHAGLTKNVAERIAALKSADGGTTRQMVIVSAMRGGQSRLELARKRCVKAAEAVGRSTNFRLDAHDMRLRGLQMRLSRRRDLIRSTLQGRADQRTVAQRQAETSETRRKVEEYEYARGEMVIELIDRMDALRGLDDDMLERSQLEAAIERYDGEIGRLEEQDLYLAEQLEQAKRSGPQPDRIVAVVARESEQVAGVHRARHAATAGAAVFGVVWLFCVLMIVRNPFRRRQSPALALAIGEPPTGELAREPS